MRWKNQIKSGVYELCGDVIPWNWNPTGEDMSILGTDLQFLSS